MENFSHIHILRRSNFYSIPLTLNLTVVNNSYVKHLQGVGVTY